MKQTKKPLPTVLAVLVLIILAGLLVFMLTDKAVLYTDRAFSMVIPSSEIRELRVALLKKGILLKIRVLETEIKTEEFDSHAVFSVFSPAVCNWIAENEFNVSSSLSNSICIGLGTDKEEFFDIVLVSDINTGLAQVPNGAEAIDYRMILGSDNYDYVVCPDLDTSLEPFIKTSKGEFSHFKGILLYECKTR